MYYYFLCRREEFLGHYHTRSNVEATFSAIKRKFGDSVRSKGDVAMRSEVLCKIVAHNICVCIAEWYALGIEPVFATGAGCTNNAASAHIIPFRTAEMCKAPATKEQRRWVHKTANVLDKLPKGQQPKAKAMPHDIWQAATKAEAEEAFDLLVATYQARYAKATACLAKDREGLLAFYGFPAEHWVHLRTTKTKGSGSRSACLAMVFKLMESAAKSWRLLNGSTLLAKVIAGVRFVDGAEQTEAA